MDHLGARITLLQVRRPPPANPRAPAASMPHDGKNNAAIVANRGQTLGGAVTRMRLFLRGTGGSAMSLMRNVRRKAKAAVAPLVFLALTGYFAWSTTQGDHGLKAYAARQQDLVLAQASLTAAEAEQAAWAHRVAGLRSTHLDLDTLDERARAMLNLADPNEIVVPYPPGQRLF